jgi:hypothetical protein
MQKVFLLDIFLNQVENVVDLTLLAGLQTIFFIHVYVTACVVLCIQSNLCVTTTFGTEKSGCCSEVVAIQGVGLPQTNFLN